jgi:ketosteroid isomerase-like protein
MSPTRRSVLAAAGPVMASAAALTGASGAAANRSAVPATDSDVSDLVARAAQAHTQLMRGDVPGYRALITATDDFTLMAPFGGKPTRAADLTNERWESVGRFFRNGKDSSLELVQAYRSADMVVLAVIERTHVEVGGLPGQNWALRVTLVFRKQNDRWLLAHRHADPLAEGISLKQAAALTEARSSS